MKVVIMAGGKGTRISSVASDIPKPMIKIEDKPVLEHEIECLRSQGFTDLIITVSHLGNIIMDYFGDGSKFGVNIEYFNEVTPLGNAGALFQIKDKLTEDFLLINADAIFDIDFNRLVNYHKEKGGLVTLFTHPNSHPYDSGLIIADNENRVLKWLAKDDKKIEFLGRISDDDLKSYLLACDIFCFPSITKNEAFGVGLAEAMYYSKPAITFNIPGSGVNFVSLKDETGLEVENSNPEKYAEAINILASNDELKNKYSAYAKKRVEELFLYSSFKEAVKSLLKEVIE